jgi:hypothetical protein
MDVAGQLDTLGDTILEAREDRALETSCGLARHRSVVQAIRAGDAALVGHAPLQKRDDGAVAP